MPSTRTFVYVSAAVSALGQVGTAAAQSPGGTGLGLGAKLGIGLVVSFVVFVLFGGALVAIGPRYATETSRSIREDPGGAFVWGLLVSILVPIALVLLALTIIGLIVAIPGLLLLIPIGVVGTAVTVVTVGAALRGSGGEASGSDALIGAVALAVPAAIPVIGDFVVSVATLFGTGVVGRRLYESWRE